MKVCSSVTFANQTQKPKTDPTALFKLSYGLFVLTAKDGEKENGCIINTAFQVANEPTKIAISCQKGNLTREMIGKTREFNLSVLTEEVPFEVIRKFGMQTGRDVTKFEECTCDSRAANGIRYVPKYTNAFFSVKVENSVDLGSNELFIGKVIKSKVISDKPSCTKAYYHSSIKPKK